MSRKAIDEILEKLNSVILGKSQIIENILCCFFAKGHILLEDTPGVGKTTLSKAFANTMGLPLSRIQFTNDTLPSDLIGYSLHDGKTEKNRIIKGPLFNHFILIDELNRGNPKSQSALLQAMEEREISIDGITFQLPYPFFVFANQNPLDSIGTHPLPESQLDRFMMSLSLGFPSYEDEMTVVRSQKIKDLSHIKACITLEEINQIQDQISQATVTDELAGYVVRILNYSREHEQFYNLSPRAGQDLISCAKARAYIKGSENVLPEHVQDIISPCVGHRICQQNSSQKEFLTKEIIQNVALYS